MIPGLLSCLNGNLILHCRQDKIVTTNHSWPLWANENMSTLKGKLCVPLLEDALRYKICREQASRVDSDIVIFHLMREVRVNMVDFFFKYQNCYFQISLALFDISLGRLFTFPPNTAINPQTIMEIVLWHWLSTVFGPSSIMAKFS